LGAIRAIKAEDREAGAFLHGIGDQFIGGAIEAMLRAEEGFN